MTRRASATAQRILTNPASEHYILVYDVHNDPRRKRLFRALSGWMQPVQRSVLEGVLTKAELGKVVATAEEIIGPNDSVKVFRQASKVPSVVLGTAQNLVKAQLKPTKPFKNPARTNRGRARTRANSGGTRLYHIAAQAIDPRTGEARGRPTIMTSSPLPHARAVTMLGKFTRRAGRRLMLVESTG